MIFQEQIKVIDSHILELEQKRQRLLQATDILRALKELVDSVDGSAAIASVENEVMGLFSLREQAYELCESWDFASPLACRLSDKPNEGTDNKRACYAPGQFCQVLHSAHHPNSQGRIGVIEYISSIDPEFPLTLVIDGELQYFKPEELMIVPREELVEVYDGENLEFL